MVELETLKVIFESIGANKIVSDLTKIQSSIEKLNKSFEKNAESTKKYLNAYNDISKSQARLWATISNNVKTHTNIIFKAYDKEIQKLEEIKKLRKSIYSSGTGRSSTPDIFNGEKTGWETGNMVSMILNIFKGIFNFREFAEQKRQETYRRYNQEQLNGSRANNAVGYDIALTKYGAIRGEGLESLRNFSVGLGAATRGDISLLRTLGKWGIGGINPQEDPMNVAKAIAQRSKGLSKNERLAMYSEVGFTDAQAMAAEKGDWEMFKKVGSPLSISEAVKQASESYAESSQKLIKALNKLNDWISNLTPLIDEFIKIAPELALGFSFLKGFSTTIKSLSPLMNTSKGGMWALAGKTLGSVFIAAVIGYFASEFQKKATSVLHKNGYISNADNSSELNSAFGKISGLKGDNRNYWQRNWDNLKGTFWGLPFRWEELIPKKTELTYHSAPSFGDLHNNYAQKQANVINQTININGSNAQEIGQEVANATKQAMAY